MSVIQTKEHLGRCDDAPLSQGLAPVWPLGRKEGRIEERVNVTINIPFWDPGLLRPSLFGN